MTEIEIFFTGIVGVYATMFAALYVPIAKEDLRRRKAQRRARAFLASVEANRTTKRSSKKMKRCKR